MSIFLIFANLCMHASRQAYTNTHTHTPVVACNYTDTPSHEHDYLKSSKIFPLHLYP